MPRLSRRLPWHEEANRISAAISAQRASGADLFDLTETNPTRVGLLYPEEELSDLLGRAARGDYRPDPRGLPEAREALAAALSRPGDLVSPDDLVLTASTSEAYGFLLKLLADPGDEVLTPVPSYPLLDHLTALEGVALRLVPLAWEGRFSFDPTAAATAVTPSTRALMVVSPNNPTGSFLRRAEQEAAAALCAERGLALVSDEVFADYPLTDDSERAGPAAARGRVEGEAALAFSLGGLSKGAGLPHWKLGWIRVGGPAAERRRALAGLELIADSYLSVSSPVQRALPDLLIIAPRIREAIRERLITNLTALAASLAGLPAVALLPPEGGWSAVLRVPRVTTDEELALGLLRDAGVLVQPGYFFDFPADGYLVLSLLPEPHRFAAGTAQLAGYLGGLL